MFPKKIIFLILILLYLALPQRSFAVTGVGIVGNTINITISINLIGQEASNLTDIERKRLKKMIQDAWNAVFDKYGCYDITLNINFDVGDTSENFTLPSDFNKLSAHKHTGSHVWYVVPVPEGVINYRSWVYHSSIAYKGDGFGAISSKASDFTYIHEIGHMLGIGDKYDKETNRPKPGWEGNGMAQIIPPDVTTNPTKYFDERNIEEILEAIEDQTGREIFPCLTLGFALNTIFHNEPTNRDIVDSTMEWKITPVYAEKQTSGMITEKQAQGITGSGTGIVKWKTQILDPRTSHVSQSIINNPFPIKIEGSSNGFGRDDSALAYTVKPTSGDIIETVTKMGAIQGPGTYQTIIKGTDTMNCKGLVGRLDNLTLMPNQLDKGDTCPLQTDTSGFTQLHYTGIGDLTIKSQQGNTDYNYGDL